MLFTFLLVLTWRYYFGRTVLEPTVASQAIAAHLHVSLLAVKSDLQNLMEKLTLRTRLESEVSLSPRSWHRGVVPPD